jgi:hypothetical protein
LGAVVFGVEKTSGWCLEKARSICSGKAPDKL